MTEQQAKKMEKLKQQADTLWHEIEALGKEYWSFYEDAFLSGEPYGRTRIKELYKKEELPF